MTLKIEPSSLPVQGHTLSLNYKPSPLGLILTKTLELYLQSLHCCGAKLKWSRSFKITSLLLRVPCRNATYVFPGTIRSGLVLDSASCPSPEGLVGTQGTEMDWSLNHMVPCPGSSSQVSQTAGAIWGQGGGTWGQGGGTCSLSRSDPGSELPSSTCLPLFTPWQCAWWPKV